MLGFSLPKVLFLFFILIIIWNVFRYIEKRSERRKKNMKESNFFSDSNSDKEEALIECLKCGNFFSSSYHE